MNDRMRDLDKFQEVFRALGVELHARERDDGEGVILFRNIDESDNSDEVHFQGYEDIKVALAFDKNGSFETGYIHSHVGYFPTRFLWLREAVN